MFCLTSFSLYGLGGRPSLLLAMDSQLETVRQEILEVKGKIAKTKQKLAAAEHAPNGDKDLLLSLNNQLLSLNNQVLSLNKKENILLRNQAPSKPCLQLVHIGLPVFTSFCAPFISKSFVVTIRLTPSYLTQLYMATNACDFQAQVSLKLRVPACCIRLCKASL